MTRDALPDVFATRADDPCPATPTRPGSPTHPVSRSRRRVLLASGGLLGVGLAGCLGTGGGEEIAPIALSGNLQCDVCGMVIEKHPGPSGQVFYRNRSPEGHENPARFCSLKQGLFPYHLEHEAMGWRADAIFVTDYSSVEYDLYGEGETTYISSHSEAASFAPARDLSYVVGTGVQGSMGPDFIPFSDREAADAFAGEHDGDVVAYEEIDEGLIGR